MRIRLLKAVHSDLPCLFFPVRTAEARIYDGAEVKVNPHGAVSVLTPQGWLGVKPNEYEPVIEWPMELR